jgi:hypothetical protein
LKNNIEALSFIDCYYQIARADFLHSKKVSKRFFFFFKRFIKEVTPPFIFKKMIIFAYYDFYHSMTEYITNEITIVNKQAEYNKLDAKFQITKFENCIKNYGLNLTMLESYY